MSRPLLRLAPRDVAVRVGAGVGVAYGALLVLSSGQGHPWSLGHSWLADGGIDVAASVLALVTAAATALVAPRPDREPLLRLPALARDAGRGLVREWTAASDGDRDAARSPRAFLRDEGWGEDALPAHPFRPEAVSERDKVTVDVGAGHDASDARAGFARQLGRPAGPVGRMPLHARCVIALAAAHAVPDLAGTDGGALRVRLATLWTHPASERRDAAVEAVIAPVLDATADWVLPRLRHAYVNPLLARLVGEAGARTPIPVGELAWLKDVDAPAWYAVDGVGRPRPLVEGAGTACHLDAELEAGGPIREPQVEGAVEGLLAALRVSDDAA